MMATLPRLGCCAGGAWKGAKQPLPVSLSVAYVANLLRPPVFQFFGEGGGMELRAADSSMTVYDAEGKVCALPHASTLCWFRPYAGHGSTAHAAVRMRTDGAFPAFVRCMA